MSGTAWGAVRTLARLELRRRWRAVAVLGVACGLLAGAVLAVASLQWRTESAYSRLVERSGLEDIQVSLFHQFTQPAQQAAAVRATADNADRLAARPEVAGAARIGNFLGRLSGPGLVYVSVAAPTRPYAGIGRPVVIRGRAPHDGSATEVIVEEGRSKAAHIGLGDRIPLDLLTTRQFLQFSTGIGRPAGGHVELTVVGVFRYPQPGKVYGSLVAAPAFERAHRSVAVGRSVLLRTRDHAGAAGFVADVEAMNERMTTRFGPGQMPYVVLSAPRSTPDPGLGPTRAVLRSGLLTLAAVLLAAGLVFAFQLAGRWSERGRASQQIEAVLGLRTRERVLARLLAALPAVALAAAGGLAGALLGGFAEPLGALRRYEPDPGWLASAPLVVGGPIAAAVAVVAVVAVVTAAIVRGGRTGTGLRRRRIRGRRPTLPLLAGALAARRGGPTTAMPTRSVVGALAAVIALTVVVADAHSQLDGLADRPDRWGWTADLQVVDDTPAADALLARDPRVRDLEQVTSANVRLRHGARTATLDTYGRATLRGRLPWTTAAGSVPRAAGEVALGLRAAHDLGAGVGDRVTLIGAGGRATRATVVGLVVLPVGNGEPLGSNALVTKAQLARLTASPPYSGVFVRARSDAAAGALRAELGRDYELDVPRAPDTVTALDELAPPTRILLGVLFVVLLLLVGQAIRLVLRRRGSQLRIAHTLGLPRSRLVVATTAAVGAGAVVAAAVGVPLGWSVGRLVGREVGPRLGLALDAPALGPCLLVGAAAAAVALLVAVVAAASTVSRLPVDAPRD